MTFSLTPGPDAAPKGGSLPERLVDAAVERAPERAYEAALALARVHGKSGPPATFTREGTRIQTPALTLLCRVAIGVHARTGRVPDAEFDAMSEAQLGAPATWPALAPYYAALPGDRRDAFFLGLAARGWKHSWPATFSIDVDDVLEPIAGAMTPAGREELLAKTAEDGDYHAVLDLLRRYPSARVLDIVCRRVRGSLAEMENWAKDDIEEQAERDAKKLGALGYWAAGVLARHAREGGDPPVFANALQALRSPVHAAVRDTYVELDERGLVPLADARRLVGETRVYRKGEGEMVQGTFVLESDRVWAAILSLEDVGEFVREATRISWEFHVRGRDNTAPLERYGAGILPWLRSRLRADGVLVNVPWCVVPCLLGIEGREALELALATHAVHELLPDQPPLGGGPGAFAADDAGDPSPSHVHRDADAVEAVGAPAKAFLSPTEGLDLGRRWLAQNTSGYGPLVELAESGNERALALLRDRAQALGGVVVEAIAAALGQARADAVARRFDLPRSTLSSAVHAALDAAPVVDVPRGPVWSIAELDDAARQYELQLWDNMNYTTGAMRVTGFASSSGDALTVETIESSMLQSSPLRWRMCAYGPGAAKRWLDEELVEEGDFDDVDLYEDRVDAVTNHLHLGGDRDEQGQPIEGSPARVVPSPIPFAWQGVPVRRALSEDDPPEIRLTYRLPASFASLPEETRAKLRDIVNPMDATVFRLCAGHAASMWPTDDALREAVGAPEDARKLFQFDLLAWPSAGDPASSSEDLVTIAEALRTRRAIERLPSTPNTRPEDWLRVPDDAEESDEDEAEEEEAEDSSEEEYDSWGGEDILDPEPSDPPLGASPYWSDVLTRGWPHGVTLMHAPNWNAAGQAEQTVPYLLEQQVEMMHVFWPRRTACIFLRAVGALEERWSAKDPGAVRAMTQDSLVGLGEARGIVRALATRAFPVPAHAGSDVALLLEALVGGRQTVELFADVLAQLPAGAWDMDRPALAAAIFELGFVLRRCKRRSEQVPGGLAAAYDAARTNDVARALDRVLHGRAGAERSARAEIDYAHVEDVAWAKGRILDPSTSGTSFDAVLYPVGGDALLDKWEDRIVTGADVRWPAIQLCALGGDRALSLVLRLYAERAECRDTVKSKLREIDGIAESLERLTEGPHGSTAQELIDAFEE
jgi:hypothetical protein